MAALHSTGDKASTLMDSATHFKADMKSYIPLETAAIFFSSEPFSKTGY